jgi:hypothetical protein
MADIRGNGLVTAWSPGQSAALDKAARRSATSRSSGCSATPARARPPWRATWRRTSAGAFCSWPPPAGPREAPPGPLPRPPASTGPRPSTGVRPPCSAAAAGPPRLEGVLEGRDAGLDLPSLPMIFSGARNPATDLRRRPRAAGAQPDARRVRITTRQANTTRQKHNPLGDQRRLWPPCHVALPRQARAP